jgi:HAMP domain-containing protein
VTESVELVVQTPGHLLAMSQAHAVQGSSITLILIVALSLASSVLIVCLYVSRNLIGRLTALSNSMMEIAGGNLRTLPPVDSDEIGRMAAASPCFATPPSKSRRRTCVKSPRHASAW